MRCLTNLERRVQDKVPRSCAARAPLSSTVRCHVRPRRMKFNGMASLLTCAVTLVSCAGMPATNGDFSRKYAASFSLCDLLAHSNEHVGLRVHVRGIYVRDPHRRMLIDSACSSKELMVRLDDRPESLASDRQMYQLSREAGATGVRVVYSGRLVSEPVVVINSIPSQFAYTLVDAKLESVEWPPQRR
jgi:hypothetical protein